MQQLVSCNMELFNFLYPLPFLIIGFMSSFKVMNKVAKCDSLSYCCCQRRLLILIFGFPVLALAFITNFYTDSSDIYHHSDMYLISRFVFNVLFLFLWNKFNHFINRNFLGILELLAKENTQKKEAHRDMEELADKYVNDIKDCRYRTCSAK